MIETLDNPRMIQPLQYLNLIKHIRFFSLDEFLGDDFECDGSDRVSWRRSFVPGRSDDFTE